MSTHILKPPKLRRYHILESISSKTFIPREYQVELLHTARKKNTIICLGTGTGKTFVAVMLIKEFSHQIRDLPSKGGKRTVFLAPTVPLVLQQAKMIMDCTDLTVGQYFGNELDRWSKDSWLSEIEKNQVFVMTPDIFKMILHHGFLPFSLFNLVIIDECHRAVKNHPYCEIMKCFDVLSAENQPKILGLSASLVNNKCQPIRIEHHIRHLETILNSTVETASDLTALSKYGSKPKEFIAIYESYSEEEPVLFNVISSLNKALVFLDSVNINHDPDDYLSHPCRQPRRYLIELSYVIMDLGLWCALRAIHLFMDEIDLTLESLYSPQHKCFLLLARTILLTSEVQIQSVLSQYDLKTNLTDKIPLKLKTLLNLLIPYKPVNIPANNDETNASSTEGEVNKTNIPVDSPLDKSKDVNNLNIVSDIKVVENKRMYKSDIRVKRGHKYNSSPDDGKALCGLVFVQQRIVAYLLSEWLSKVKENVPDLNFLSPNYIIGHGKNISGIKSLLMGFEKQEEVLQKFRTKACNLVIATSVIEEGMDLPKCNLVIRFDPPENFRAYVQSKGRARVNDSSYILMIKASEKKAFEDTLSDYKTVEELLLIKCHKADRDMDEPVTEDNIDDLIPPYMPIKEDGCARVTISSAIALVNRYCAKLPSDTFTRLTPKWKIVEKGSLFQCILKLPINSPLKKVMVGPWMKSKQLSKMAVALQTCIELHKSGELDDNLLPTGKEAVKSEDFMLDDTDENFKKEDSSERNKDEPKNDEDARKAIARPGTTKRRMFYFKKVADALRCSIPSPNTTSYLYVFDMKLTCPIPEEQNTRGRKIHDPSNTLRNFGILTNKPVPPICSFPVFTRSGEVTVSLKGVNTDLVLNESKIQSLAYFHRYTFSEVLRLEKYPMSYTPSESEASFFVVPLTSGTCDDELTIDWKFIDLIYKHNNTKPQKVSDETRKDFKFVLEAFQDAVVMPWYRNLDKPQFFYVAEICSNLTPTSDFPDMEYETFESYYKKKYDITIMNHEQPLLDVDHTSARLNLLTPRYVNRKGVTLPTSSEQTKRTKRENLQQKQILIPELCTVHPFPAYLWRKAVCLPCILYRLNSLLLAEQLRLLVANSISIGITILPKDFQWPPLDFGWTLADILTAQAESKETKSTQLKPINGSLNHTLKNGYVNPINIPNGYINNVSPYSNYTPDTCVNNVMDFEIDVFDPSKVFIPDDDALLEQELKELNFGMGGPMFDTNCFSSPFGENGFQCDPVSAFPIWQPKTADCDENGYQVRCGSPSFFEGSGWDSEWDTEDTDTPFLSVDVQGLGYISAPGIINMQSLSMDLASCKDDDAWDSMDDDSINSDDEENFPAYTKPSLMLEQNGVTNTKVSKGCEEVCECSWLTCPIYKDEFSSVLVNSIDVDVDESVSTAVIALKEYKKRELNYLNSDKDSQMLTKSSSLFEEVFQAVMENEKSLRPSTIFSSCDIEQDTSSLVFSDKNMPGGINSESTLAFGELLPDRENHQLYDNMNRVTFDENNDVSQLAGPSPSIILQALTMSNANDGINLERLETVGDSFLKYAITVYLFCMYPNIHEGKLSYLRSKQISNYNLYKLGKRKGLGELMVASKFEPYDNWLPPNYVVPKGLEEALIESGIPSASWNLGNWSDLTQMSEEEIRQSITEKTRIYHSEKPSSIVNPSSLVPYNLLTQHSIPDKSIADCVEALIGAYLISCGSRGALLFMSWLGLRVLPTLKSTDSNKVEYGFLQPPPSPILIREPKSNIKLEKLLAGYSAFEKKIDYSFNDKSCLLQAFTHASYYYNTLTDCYQRLEFLGDAVLDYLITRHLYEDPKKHSPGTLTDLRSALVNNTFFASLAVKYDFHKFFKAISPGLFHVINKFVQLKEHNSRLEDFLQAYFLEEDECEEMEDVEVPKALGDIFESVAGAIYLDSNMSLDTVWRVYYNMMKPEIEYFSNHVPKSPIRELLELEPQTAKFERAEMTVSGKVRVCVDVFGKGQFVGVGRNKRIAKCTAAKHALRELRKNKKL